MTLRLSIENVDRLPDGGPIRIEVKGRGLDLGRDSHLDWSLPDPSRSVSGKHCEIRYRDGGYWVHDVSTNGTFVNGAEYRLDAPHRLRDGDRLSVGPYLIAVAVEEGRKLTSVTSAAEASVDAGAANVWGADRRGGGAGNWRQTSHDAVARRAARLSRFCFVPRGAETGAGGVSRSEPIGGRLADCAEARLCAASAGSGRFASLAYPRRRVRRSSTRRPRRPLPREPQAGSVPASEVLDRIARAAGVPLDAFTSAIRTNWRMKSAAFFGWWRRTSGKCWRRARSRRR